MNENLRWLLILGCLMLAALEAPRTSIVVAEDLAGPYPGEILAGGEVHAAGMESARLEREALERAGQAETQAAGALEFDTTRERKQP